MDTVFLHATLQLHWGFIVRQAGASAAQLAYPLPPPTTVIGAFANPLGRLLDMPDAMPYGGSRRRRDTLPVTNRFMECMIKAAKAAGAGLDTSGRTGVVVYEEPSRITAVPYKGGNDYLTAVKHPIYLSAQKLLPVQAVGSASAPAALMHIAMLLDAEELSRCTGRRVTLDVLEAAVWGVYRLGSRESIASVVYAGVSMDLEAVESGHFESILYQKAGCARPARSDLAVEVVMTDEHYKSTGYHVPVSPASNAAILTPPHRPQPFLLRSGCRAVWPREARTLALSAPIA